MLKHYILTCLVSYNNSITAYANLVLDVAEAGEINSPKAMKRLDEASSTMARAHRTLLQAIALVKE